MCIEECRRNSEPVDRLGAWSTGVSHRPINELISCNLLMLDSRPYFSPSGLIDYHVINMLIGAQGNGFEWEMKWKFQYL